MIRFSKIRVLKKDLNWILISFGKPWGSYALHVKILFFFLELARCFICQMSVIEVKGLYRQNRSKPCPYPSHAPQLWCHAIIQHKQSQLEAAEEVSASEETWKDFSLASGWGERNYVELSLLVKVGGEIHSLYPLSIGNGKTAEMEKSN